MSNAIYPYGLRQDDDLVLRAGLPVAEQLLDSCADALWDISDALDVLKGEGVGERYVVFEPRLQRLYEEVNSIMKELAD